MKLDLVMARTSDGRHATMWLARILFLCVLMPPGRAHAEVRFEQVAALVPATQGQRTYYGKESPLQFGVLRVPAGMGPHPVAVIIHGGCWRAAYDYRHVEAMAAQLTALGIATWVIEYRRLGDAGGGWPGTFLDVAHATDHLRAMATSSHLDLKRVIVVGHSAGGHLALWLAARAKIRQDSELYIATPLPVSGVLSLAGIADLRVYSRGTGSCNTAVNELMGGAPFSAAARYLQASPQDLAPIGVSMRFVHGADDAIVPVVQSQRFARRESSSNPDVVVDVIPGAGHFDLIAPFAGTWPAVERRALELLKWRARPDSNQ